MKSEEKMSWEKMGMSTSLICSCDKKIIPCPIHGDIPYEKKPHHHRKMVEVCLCEHDCTCTYSHFVNYLENNIPISVFYIDKSGNRYKATIIKELTPYETQKR